MKAKGVRAGLPKRTTSRAGTPMETVNIDLAGPYEASFGRSIYRIMFVDRPSRWMRLYDIKSKLETTMFAQMFLADINYMGTPRRFRTDNEGEFTSHSYTDFYDYAGIRRDYTPTGKPQHNAVVESGIWRAMKRGNTANFEVRRLFPGIDLAKIPNVDTVGNCLSLEAVLWDADCLDHSTTKETIEWRSPYEVFFTRLPELQIVQLL